MVKRRKRRKNIKAKLNRIIYKDFYVLKSYYCKNRTMRKTNKAKNAFKKREEKTLGTTQNIYI